jgi:hypothetical protein
MSDPLTKAIRPFRTLPENALGDDRIKAATVAAQIETIVFRFI